MISDRELEETIDNLRHMLCQCSCRERWPQNPQLRAIMVEHLQFALEPVCQAMRCTEEEQPKAA